MLGFIISIISPNFVNQLLELTVLNESEHVLVLPNCKSYGTIYTRQWPFIPQNNCSLTKEERHGSTLTEYMQRLDHWAAEVITMACRGDGLPAITGKLALVLLIASKNTHESCLLSASFIL